MSPKDAGGRANSVDPDQTAPFGSSLIWVCTVCSNLSVPKYRILTVIYNNGIDILTYFDSLIYSIFLTVNNSIVNHF